MVNCGNGDALHICVLRGAVACVLVHGGGVGLLRRPSCISDAETMEVQDLSFREAVSVHEGVAGARVHEEAAEQTVLADWRQ